MEPQAGIGEISGTTGGVTNVITYRNVGVILRVTPFITPEGYVEMILAPEISRSEEHTSELQSH